MPPDQPLHEHEETHLWNQSFSELITQNIEPDHETLLIISDSESEATQLETSINRSSRAAVRECLLYTEDQEDLPYKSGRFDIAVHLNPKRNPYKYHKPLYQATEVVQDGGTIIYKAPQRLAHSKKVTVDAIYSINWEDNSDPSLAALLSVTATPTVDNPQRQSAVAQQATSTTLSEYQ